MSFLHLYKFAEKLAADQGNRRFVVPVHEVRQAMLDRGYAVAIDVFAVELDEEVSLGHVVIRDTREDRYDDDGGLQASIRYSRSQNTCWARFVSCKEMMHLFDGPDEITDTKEKWVKLLQEIEAKPLQRSPALESEYKAEWMALLVLCPKLERDKFKAAYDKGDIGPYDVAWHFRIPERFVAGLMSEHYDNAYGWLITAHEEPEQADPNAPLAAE